MSQLVGKTFGRYRLEASLGRGGMAEVFRASDGKLGRAVAVKVVLPFFASQPQFAERFLREARLVAALEHPHILPIYDFGEQDGLPFLVMPYMEGGTLVGRMNGQPLPLWRVVAWTRQLAEALDAAHHAGVLHRDVKPANVLVGRGDRLMLADFGIAKMAESATRLTATGMVVGTPAYMAPELAQGRPASPASDVYALAVLAYELATGRPPFEGDSALSLLHQHVHTPAPRPSTRVAGLPAALDPPFDVALAKEPAARHPSCRAFAAALQAAIPTGEREALATLEGSLRPPPPASAPTQALPGTGPRPAGAAPAEPAPASGFTTAYRGRRRGLAWAAAAAGALVLGAGLYLLLGRGAPHADSVPAGAAAADSSLAAAPAPAPQAAPERREPPPTARAEKPAPPREAAAAPRRPFLDAARERPRKPPIGKRPTEGDFRQWAQTAAQGLERRPGQAQLEALSAYARGGLAYLAGRDGEARAALEKILARRILPAQLELGPLAIVRHAPPGALADWEVAVAYGDPRHEAAGLIDAALARTPAEPRLHLARALVQHLDGDPAGALRLLEASCAQGVRAACEERDRLAPHSRP